MTEILTCAICGDALVVGEDSFCNRCEAKADYAIEIFMDEVGEEFSTADAALLFDERFERIEVLRSVGGIGYDK